MEAVLDWDIGYWFGCIDRFWDLVDLYVVIVNWGCKNNIVNIRVLRIGD